MSISASFDQLLRGGRVICPASGIDGIRDVAIRNGKIAAVQPDILPNSAREVIDVTGKLVLPGFIDTHAHVYQYVTGRFGMNADMVGVQSGVTTLVDQGGPSCMTLPGFRHFVADPAKSRVYAFLSAYLVGGLEGHYYPKLYSPDGVDIDATVKSATANLDLVRRIKAHAEIGGFARWGIRVIEMAAEIGRRADLPVYVHFGQLWGLPDSGTNGEDVDTILERVIPLLREGDVLAHPFTRHPGGFVNREGEVHPVIQAALDRGLKVDVGSRQPFLLSPCQEGHRRRHYSRRRSARTFMATTPTCRSPPAHPTSMRTTRKSSVRRPSQVQPGAGDEFDDGARPYARAGRADGDVAAGGDARPCRRNRVPQDRPGCRRIRDQQRTDASCCATTRRTKSSPNICCSPRFVCVPARDTTRSHRSCRRRLRHEGDPYAG